MDPFGHIAGILLVISFIPVVILTVLSCFSRQSDCKKKRDISQAEIDTLNKIKKELVGIYKSIDFVSICLKGITTDIEEVKEMAEQLNNLSGQLEAKSIQLDNVLNKRDLGNDSSQQYPSSFIDARYQ